jgi:hypothetical protein
MNFFIILRKIRGFIRAILYLTNQESTYFWIEVKHFQNKKRTNLY